MEEYILTGRFPTLTPGNANTWEGKKLDFVETQVRTRQPWEILQVFTVLGICGLLWNNVKKARQVVGACLGL